MDILALEKEVDRLRIELHAAEDRLRTAKISAIGVSPGDIVNGTGRYAGNQYRVVAIDPSWSKAWIVGNPKRKDGTFGSAERHIYGNWELSEHGPTHSGLPPAPSENDL